MHESRTVTKTVSAVPQVEASFCGLNCYLSTFPHKGLRHDDVGFSAYSKGIERELSSLNVLFLARSSLGKMVIAAPVVEHIGKLKPAQKVELAHQLSRPNGPYSKSQVARALQVGRATLYWPSKQAVKDKQVAVAKKCVA